MTLDFRRFLFWRHLFFPPRFHSFLAFQAFSSRRNPVIPELYLDLSGEVKVLRGFFRPFHPCQNYDSMEQSTPILEKRQTTDNLELPPGTSRELFPPVSFHHKSLTVGIIEWTELDFTSAALRCSMYAESTEIHPECAHEKTGIRRVPKFDAGELAKERKEVTADISPQLEALFLSRTSDARRNHFFAGRRDSRYEYA